MAVVDTYVNPDLLKGKLANPANLTGNKVVQAVVTFEANTSDSAGSIYRIFPGLDSCLIPVDIKIMNDAVTAATVDVGIYNSDKGAVVNKSVFASAVSLATAHNAGNAVSGLSALDVANLGKKLYELAGDDIAGDKGTYDIALTLGAAATAAGTVTVIGTFLQG